MSVNSVLFAKCGKPSSVRYLNWHVGGSGICKNDCFDKSVGYTLEKTPHEQDVKLKSLISAYQRKDFKESVKIAKSILKRHKNHLLTLKIYSMALLAIGQGGQALVASRRCLSLSTHDHEAYNNTGIILKNLNLLEDSVIHFKEAIKLRPDYFEARLNLASAFDAIGSLEEAKKVLIESISLNQNSANAHALLGLIHVKQRLFAESVENFQHANNLDPAEITIQFNLAMSLKQLGRLAEAKKLLMEINCSNPNFFPALFTLGNILFKENKIDEAIQVFLEVIKLQPNHSEALFRLGKLMSEKGKYDDAIDFFQKSIEYQQVDSLGAIYELAKLGIGKIPKKTPSEAIKKFYASKSDLYDEFANQNYNGHKLITDAFVAANGEILGKRILDLGCGTGALGEFFSKYASELVGVDLSKAMLAQAQKTGHYHKLVESDAEKFLAKWQTGSFDYIILAAVLVHYGDLAPIFSALNGAISPNGQVVLTVFVSDEEDIQLTKNNFYSHSDPYIKNIAGQSHFDIVFQDSKIHENDGEEDIYGAVYVLQNNRQI